MLGWLVVDVTGAFALFGAGVLGVAAWRGHGRRLDGTVYWLLAGLGLMYLAVDERLSLHEHAGRKLEAAGMVRPPGVNHMDDALLALCGLVATVITVLFAGELLRHRAVLLPMTAGMALLAASIGIDAFAPVDGWAPRIEELTELAGIALVTLAFWRRWKVAAGALALVPPSRHADTERWAPQALAEAEE